MTRAVAAYLACVTFALAFLITSLTGGSILTALLRGVMVAAATWFAGQLLMRPMLSAILDAMARDRAQQGDLENAE